MPRCAPPLFVSDGVLQVLRRLLSDPSLPRRDLTRVQVILDAADAVPTTDVARRRSLTAATVRAWRRSFEDTGLAGIGRVRPGRGRRGTIPGLTLSLTVDAIIHNQRAAQPASMRTIAGELGVSEATVRRVRRELALIETPDGRLDFPAPPFVPHHVELAGVHVGEAGAMIVVSLDPQTHALLGEASSGRSSQPARPERFVSGIAVTVAALGVLVGDLSGRTGERLDDFLARVRAAVPTGTWLHAVATATDRPSRSWGSSPRLQVHEVAPNRWLDEVRAVLGRAAAVSARRDGFMSLVDLIAALDGGLSSVDGPPSSFEWVASRRQLLKEHIRLRGELFSRTEQF